MNEDSYYELALFAGAGISSLAGKHLIGRWRTVCYIEKDAYCVEIIKSRIADGYLDDAPIWSDVRTFRSDNAECGEFISELATLDNLVVTAGFPCQPFSSAGRQKGQHDPRNMWPQTLRIIRETKPRLILLENVPGLLTGSRYFGQILSDLAESGYDARWKVISAAELGAPHRRRRLWIVAHSSGERCQRSGALREQESPIGFKAPQSERRGQDARWWSAEPGMGRVAHGVASRMDKLKALGNGWVPAVAETAWRWLK